MPVGGRKVLPVAVEKEQARVASTISGREVDLPAMWNRMFEPRVLTDYGPEGFAAIAALPGGESLEWCYGCGKCTPVCPVDMVGEYGPRKIHRKVQTGTDLFGDPPTYGSAPPAGTAFGCARRGSTCSRSCRPSARRL